MLILSHVPDGLAIAGLLLSHFKSHGSNKAGNWVMSLKNVSIKNQNVLSWLPLYLGKKWVLYLNDNSPGAVLRSPARMEISAGAVVKLTNSAVEYAWSTLCAKYISSSWYSAWSYSKKYEISFDKV